ncbi:hypothetical protein HPB47_005458, partial [Ixodes persulcatus]
TTLRPTTTVRGWRRVRRTSPSKSSTSRAGRINYCPCCRGTRARSGRWPGRTHVWERAGVVLLRPQGGSLGGNRPAGGTSFYEYADHDPRFGLVLACGSSDGAVSVLSMGGDGVWEAKKINNAHTVHSHNSPLRDAYAVFTD